MQRPGIHPDTLTSHNIVMLNPDEAFERVGVRRAGMWLPYHRLDGEPTKFGRLRLTQPNGKMKYTQREGSGVHVFFPKGLPRDCDELYIIEGEFKAMALTEAGFPAIGISGFYGWQEQGRIHPELDQALAYLNPKQLYWVGDADTVLNPDFYTATSRMVGKLPVKLVRLKWDGPKGADDLRAEVGDQFESVWRGLPRVEADEDEVLMLERLLEVHKSEFSFSKSDEFTKLAKTLGRFGRKPGAAVLQDKVRTMFGLKSGLLKTAISEVVRAVDNGDIVSEEAEVVVQRSYTDGSKWYVDLNNTNRYTKLTLESWRNQLAYFGAQSEQIMQAQATVEQNRMVDFAGPLCGRSIGLHQEGSLQVLVTESYKFIEGTQGRDWQDTVPGQYLMNLIGESQCEYLLGWLQQGRKAMRNPSQNVPGQALFLVGTVGLGKTLAQRIITACLGGRAADPQNWLKGLTPFNSDLWKAEHLMISDATIQDDWKARSRLTGALKEVVANNSFPLHAKFAEALTMKPIWRLSMSANCTPNSVKALPSVDEDNADKVLMLWCERPGWEFQRGLEIWDLIGPDLDEFCGAVDGFEVSEDIEDVRYGVMGHVHPEIQQLVHGESSEGQLEGVLDLYFVDNDDELVGSSAAIYNVLKNYGPMQWIKTPKGLGMFLRKLSKTGAARYKVEDKIGHRKTKIWTIKQHDGKNLDPW